ncbi:MAG: hypothetical protein COV44_01215 [Deltaproteobacteria bacterium CG11_big_fil_rev_8_21_14_0_20_45_16]|nr:MAG: hypothetical protein COV44_01215 [Deltaproteobacteria bacterium CG11_big_fil_rev_8_21_14_0_20_45_16]
MLSAVMALIVVFTLGMGEARGQCLNFFPRIFSTNPIKNVPAVPDLRFLAHKGSYLKMAIELLRQGKLVIDGRFVGTKDFVEEWSGHLNLNELQYFRDRLSDSDPDVIERIEIGIRRIEGYLRDLHSDYSETFADEPEILEVWAAKTRWRMSPSGSGFRDRVLTGQYQVVRLVNIWEFDMFRRSYMGSHPSDKLIRTLQPVGESLYP